MQPRISRQLGPLAFALAIALSAVLAGCDTTSEEMRQLQFRVNELQDQVKTLNDRQVKDAETITTLERQVRTLQALGTRRLDKLVHVHDVRFARLTGGIDLDGQPGDEGIVVYLQPVDESGAIIKAAGSALVQVYDLQAEQGRQLIGEYEIDADQMAALWSDRFMTRHYAIRCPWSREQPPLHRDLTVRVEFTEYLTGRTFHHQAAVRVALVGQASAP
jgi:hypothetical protein